MQELTGKTILIFGGWGLVGRAVCLELLRLNPSKMIICSLLEHECREASEAFAVYKKNLSLDLGIQIDTEFAFDWGDIFARDQFKDITKRDPSDPDYLDLVIADTFDDLSDIDPSTNFLYRLLLQHKPDVVIDAVNTATAVAYQDIFKSVIELRKSVVELEKCLGANGDGLADAARRMVQNTREHMAGIYLPRLIRHVQILYKGMEAASTRHYIKIGTTGTGGMGLNIPYTHSEEKPSQKLLSKSAVGGAHSLLLYLMSKTPDMAHTMEFKPAAAIAWKKIGFGEIKARGNPIPLCDNLPEKAFELGDALQLSVDDEKIVPGDDTLSAVYIDTGENGVFSAGEFSAITTSGQMEYITPEEIASMVVEEIKGGNSGYDIMANLSNAVMRSTYRAGLLRHHAVKRMTQLQHEHQDDSVAFEILGPPRLSKLLYEAHLIKRIYQTPDKVLEVDARRMSEDFQRLVTVDTELRRRLISIGIPILMPDGKRLLRGRHIVIPPYRGSNEVPITSAKIDAWAHDGWVDLRERNMEQWRNRMRALARIIRKHDWENPDTDSSSVFNRKDFFVDGELNIGEVVGWIFNNEEKGARKFYATSHYQID